MNTAGKIGTRIGVVVALVIMAGGCGKRSEESALAEAGRVPVLGDTAFGSQCPYGTQSELSPAKIGLWDCPEMARGRIELAAPPQPLYFQADCKKKLLIVRSADYTIDTMWEVMPDGAFYVTIEGGPVRFASPKNCTSYTSLDVFGRLDCLDRDRVNIEVDALWWISKGTRPADATGAACDLPASCYLAAAQTVKQCQ
jgi:hypothetical protein